jgi:ABC-type multidrug transport system fused ATPase/permease subunit
VSPFAGHSSKALALVIKGSTALVASTSAASGAPAGAPPGWPATGDLRFEDVSLRYFPGGPLALRHISFHVTDCEKVGIVGRTGSGKTTLLVALFRMIPLAGGRMLVDGQDLCALPLKQVRASGGCCGVGGRHHGCAGWVAGAERADTPCGVRCRCRHRCGVRSASSLRNR